MTPEATALILIGYQNDYYAPDGILHRFLEDSAAVRQSLERTVDLVARLAPTAVTLIDTPIVFTQDYSELHEPVGILAAIRTVRAFQAGTDGAAAVAELQPWRPRILSIPGKRGLNAFVGTQLEDSLRARGIEGVVLLGSVASICIDSTGRAAAEKGFRVHFVSDCITGRTRVEHQFYCEQVFPLYGQVMTASALADHLLAG